MSNNPMLTRYLMVTLLTVGHVQGVSGKRRFGILTLKQAADETGTIASDRSVLPSLSCSISRLRSVYGLVVGFVKWMICLCASGLLGPSFIYETSPFSCRTAACYQRLLCFQVYCFGVRL
jgi:hypothetical protein